MLGVELSGIAVQSFFEENGCTHRHIVDERFECHEADDIRLLCGDFFDLEPRHLAMTIAVFDRASLVALPPEMRERYVRHLGYILPTESRILLVTFDYLQEEMSGLPFAVTMEEVFSLYRDMADIRSLAQEDVLALNPQFRARGISSLRKNVFLLALR